MPTRQQKNDLIAHARHIRSQVLELWDKLNSIGEEKASKAATKILLEFNNLEISISQTKVDKTPREEK